MAKFGRAELGLPAIKRPQADIWIGRFPDQKSGDRYFNETEQREPVASVSRFAAEQGLEFRDYDFFARRFGVSDLRSVCWEVFVPQTDLSAIIAALNRSPSVRFNTVAMQVAELTEAGRLRSVTGDGYWLHYLGRFEYEPRET